VACSSGTLEVELAPGVRMQPFYSRTQTGQLLRWAIIPPALGLLAAGYLGGKAALFLPIALALGGIGWVFSSLTVEVSATELTWFFGPGLWRKSIERDEIVSAIPVRNEWWWGWGIHLTPRGWLYNVSGMEAVEIVLRSGKMLRIGSDEASALADALLH
jgi:hypothetical protein